MQILYIDNFRGFNDTFIELKKVNFLVGENSTGKTSILKLIKILASPSFLIKSDFNIEEAELGYFSEIVSANSKKKYFEIGVLESDTNDGEIRGIKLKFVEKNGLPFVMEVRVIDNYYDLHGIHDKGVFKYRYRSVVLENKKYLENQFDYFKRWIENNYLKNKTYKTQKYSGVFSSYSLLYNILFVFEEERRLTKLGPPYGGFFWRSIIKDITWMAPIRTEPRRTYDSYKTRFSPDGIHAPYVLKDLLSKKRGTKARERVENILQKFGKDSGLFNKIEINTLGKTATSPFEIHLYLNNNPLKITNVGYGVSQILPLIIEIISRENHSWFAIQQPEIHLHPKAQASFGEFIYKSCKEDDMNFIIETHSDYTIDRFRIKLYKDNQKKKKKNKKGISSQVIFFKRTEKGNQLHCIDINNKGSYGDNLPEDFRNFFLKEELELLNI